MIDRKINRKCIWAMAQVHPSNMGDLTPTTNQMAHHDAENDQFVVEFKQRNSKYDGTTLIEKQKYDHNIATGKRFVYAVAVGNELYLFDVTKMKDEGYDFGWHDKKQPATTAFERREWVTKRVGYISFNDAKTVIDLETGQKIR